MGVNQGGSVGRDNIQIQAEGDVTVNLGGDGSTGGDAAPDKKPSPRLWLLAVPVGILLLVGALQQRGDPRADNGAFVLPGDRWPAGATLDAVTGPVLAGLRSCAKATSAEPVNCPQRAGSVNDQVSDVRWELVGDPADGARASFHDGRFDVIGHAVMTVAYKNFTSAVVERHPVRFRASVAWRDGRAELVGGAIRPTKVEPSDRPITKQRPAGDQTARVQAALRKAFADCLASRRSPLPPACPQDPLQGTGAKTVDWTFDGDPLQNVRVTNDDAWGLIRVRGDFALNGTYHDLFGRHPQTFRGVYEATLVASKDGVTVLQIQKT